MDATPERDFTRSEKNKKNEWTYDFIGVLAIYCLDGIYYISQKYCKPTIHQTCHLMIPEERFREISFYTYHFWKIENVVGLGKDRRRQIPKVRLINS